MFFRFGGGPALALLLAGCATNITGIEDGASALDALRVENKGLVLIHTSLHDQGCPRVLAKVAHPDAGGRYIEGEEIALKRILNRPDVPIEVQLPAGEYGIVRLECENRLDHRIFFAHPAERGNILTGEGAIYEQPIAKFNVRAGEFVDVGSLQLWTNAGKFKAQAVPIADSVVQTMAAAKPAIYTHLVRRLMTTPDQAQQSGPVASPRAAR